MDVLPDNFTLPGNDLDTGLLLWYDFKQNIATYLSGRPSLSQFHFMPFTSKGLIVTKARIAALSSVSTQRFESQTSYNEDVIIPSLVNKRSRFTSRVTIDLSLLLAEVTWAPGVTPKYNLEDLIQFNLGTSLSLSHRSSSTHENPS